MTDKIDRSATHLWLTTPNDYSLIYKAEHLLSRKYPPHFHQFNEKDLRDILARAGFRIVLLHKFIRGTRTGTLSRISRNCFFVHVVPQRSFQQSL